MDQFRARVEAKHGPGIAQDYHSLWKWSCSRPNLFWAQVWDEVGIIASKKYDQVLPPNAPIYPPPRWFEGARLNIAENLLERHRKSTGIALIECAEAAPGSEPSFTTLQTLTFSQLRSRVAQAAGALRKRGVTKNDCVAVYGANCVVTTIAFLAASSIGAVFVSAAADFAEAGTLERLRTVRPKVLFGVNAVRYNGKILDHVAKVEGVVKGLEADRSEDEQPLELTVLADLVPEHSVSADQACSTRNGWTSFDDFLKEGQEFSTIEYEQLDFNHPVWILFSSGTTGAPKAITHRAGGMLIQLAKEHLIHGGLSEKDVFFQYTTPGWMMMNFAWGALIAGCPLILYDGSPLKPASVLWEMASQHGVTVFGTSASYLSALNKSGYRPKDHFNNLKVRQILSTGSPLRADLYPWILEAIGSDILIGSITGGTDICSLFAGHNEALPVRAGELQARNLGMDVDVFDDAGKSVGLGNEGDLVCKTPFPAQPLGFWRQPESKYKDSYYSQFPGVWFHGDFCMLSEDQGLVMLGRSDGILNPGGIRFGSSEIYETLEKASDDPSLSFLDSIEDSLVVALKTTKGDDEVVVLFLVLRSGEDEASFDALATQVKTLIRARRSARHVPAFVYQVSGVPKTLNGKRVEVPVKKLINGASLESINKATLLNPEVLSEYVEAGTVLRQKLASR
ncbi:unnamed protein product [Tilletia controversa]|nr:hypothetical protein CF335_g2950 [Tilletia laevis]CAD6897799.1 unnamed protein product [Tilletia controversa]CAD6911352.1 unnamed protein product [Tilletia caries]CAD6914420.1 unnamed protein product [Tilletia caries]CAD6941875.1 unnamed protein product [Tilletia controversa]